MPSDYLCHICGKNVKSNKIKAHIESHYHNKNYKCKECGKALSTKDVLLRHKLVHSNVAKYKCITCETSSTTVSTINEYEGDEAHEDNNLLQEHVTTIDGENSAPCFLPPATPKVRKRKPDNRQEEFLEVAVTHLKKSKNEYETITAA
ncbi:hypothetical protein NQ314_018754 [Rhamnusium bicolor]|uniref:C2H2-type domain-containing protein n=1 Tax=Rhamnusium bicolor TaxID=1586634 RepID=A0AAV8WPF6_9CUCU|nr:hypothetical protein NQ314_018754 [Rhamnusium bicolor]